LRISEGDLDRFSFDLAFSVFAVDMLLNVMREGVLEEEYMSRYWMLVPRRGIIQGLLELSEPGQ
jgi:hypothetical protein